jgi:hypothetical protein
MAGAAAAKGDGRGGGIGHQAIGGGPTVLLPLTPSSRNVPASVHWRVATCVCNSRSWLSTVSLAMRVLARALLPAFAVHLLFSQPVTAYHVTSSRIGALPSPPTQPGPPKDRHGPTQAPSRLHRRASLHQQFYTG